MVWIAQRDGHLRALGWKTSGPALAHPSDLQEVAAVCQARVKRMHPRALNQVGRIRRAKHMPDAGIASGYGNPYRSQELY
jgi:hypothetical protein